MAIPTKKITELEPMPSVQGTDMVPIGRPGSSTGNNVTVKQLSDHAEAQVKANAAHVSGETADQAKLSSVGKVMELIGSGMRVEPITSTPATLDQSVIYLVHDSNEDVVFGTETVPAGTTSHVYYDGNGWVVVEDRVDINRESVTKSSQTIIENFVIGSSADVEGIETLSDTTITYHSKLGTYSGPNVYYFSVNKGERFNILINSVGSPGGTKGFRVALKEGASAPSLNDTVTSLQVLYVENSIGEVHPTEIQFIAQSDGYLCFNGTDGVIVSIDKYEYKKPEASSYIEENIVVITDKTNLAYTNLYRTIAKRYKLERGVKYMVIAGPGYGSNHIIEISFYDSNMGVIPDTTVTYTDPISNRKIIEADDFLALIPNDAVYCEIKAQLEISAALTKGGTCALLREVDGIFAPQNNYIYGVSKIKIDDNSYVWSAWGFKLPNNYSSRGNATQIVTYIHGSSGFVTSYMMGYNNPIVHDKLLDNGFAVLDINGCGVYFSNDVDTSKCAGNPVAVETLAEAYYAIRKTFNVKDGMVISGVSMGGCLMETFTMRHPELVKFIAFLAPMILSGYQLGGNINNTAYAMRAWDADYYDEFQQNCVGYVSMSNPMTLVNGTTETITPDGFIDGVGFKTTDEQDVAQDGSNVVLDSFSEGTYRIRSKFAKSGKIWLGTNDTNINKKCVLRFVSAARLNGCNFDLRICPGLDHSLATNNNYVLDELIGYINSKL